MLSVTNSATIAATISRNDVALRPPPTASRTPAAIRIRSIVGYAIEVSFWSRCDWSSCQYRAIRHRHDDQQWRGEADRVEQPTGMTGGEISRRRDRGHDGVQPPGVLLHR